MRKKAPPARKPKAKKLTVAQILLQTHLGELGIETIPEYQFWLARSWRFDLADVSQFIAFECNGGKWSGGHQRGKAIEDENDKLNKASLMGWRVMQFTNEQIIDGRAKSFIAEHLLAQH